MPSVAEDPSAFPLLTHVVAIFNLRARINMPILDNTDYESSFLPRYKHHNKKELDKNNQNI
jgi:hypothetical protein